MPEPASDPRVYLAAERTMLAWLRTGMTIMAFGFVVARFGLFLRPVEAGAGTPARPGLSPYLGTVLVALGVIAMAGGAVQYSRFCRTLSPSEPLLASTPRFVLALSWALILVGIVLGIVLLAQ